MSQTIKHARAWNQVNKEPVRAEKEQTVGSVLLVSEAITDEVVDKIVTCAIDYSALKSLFVSSDQDITIELKNPGGSSAAADETWVLKANQPIDWQTGDVMDAPLSADVTVIYVTNASGSTANLEIRVGQDPTP